MVDETRTVQKDFNRDLLREQLTGSALPFESLHLAGFVRLGRFRGTPAPGPRVISSDGVAGTQDIAQPGEIRFVFRTALTAGEGAVLDSLLANHVSTNRTARQSRLQQDEDDFDQLESLFPNYDSFNNGQFRSFVKLLARVVIRERRNSSF